MAAIRRLQANPELGEFRVHAALAQQGIDLSPRTCGRIREVTEPRLFVTGHASPQPFLASLEDVVWHPAQRLMPYRAAQAVRRGAAGAALRR
jgi:hypothetical protein